MLHTTRWGSLVWPCDEVQLAQGVRAIEVRVSLGTDALWKVLFSLEDWHILPVKPSSPLMLRSARNAGVALDAVHLVVDGQPQEVLVAMALECFPSVTDFFIERLVSFLAYPLGDGEEAPTTMLARAEFLIRRLLPGKTPAEYAEILARRVRDPRTTPESQSMGIFSDSSALASADCVLDSSDKRAVQEQVENAESAKVSEVKVLEFLQMRGYPIPQSLAFASDAMRKARTPATTSTKQIVRLMRDSAKRFLPKVTGVVLQPYPTQMRYQVYYPTVCPPRSHVERWGGETGRGELQALTLCMQWAWSHHTLQSGESCQFDFVV